MPINNSHFESNANIKAININGADAPILLTATTDDNGKGVLRIVDAAPFAYDAVSGRLLVTANSLDTWRSATFLDNTANNNKTYTVPAGKEYKIQCIYVTLAASATVGNRIIVARFDNGTSDFFSNRFEVAITAGQTRCLNLAPGLPLSTAFSAGEKATAPIPEMIMAAGYRFRLYDAANVDATESLTYAILASVRSV